MIAGLWALGALAVAAGPFGATHAMAAVTQVRDADQVTAILYTKPPNLPSPVSTGSAFTDPSPVAIGDMFTFDAGHSTAPSGIAGYEWDLDGDGTFETPSGAVQTVTFTKPGTVTIAVRVTSVAGGVATATNTFNVSPAPPVGDVGMSIDAGAQFTNTPKVTLSLIWPVGAINVRVSNDGGFAGAQQFALAPTVPWTLQSSGPERLPKTVYVRYGVGGLQLNGMPTTYQDDIILDETPPTVSQVALVGPAAGARAARARIHTDRLKIKATDALSGVAGLQITDNRGKPGRLLAYSTHATLRTARSTIYVRAKDNAGNLSGWHRASAHHR